MRAEFRNERRMARNPGHYISGCVGKVSYPSRKVALAGLRRMEQLAAAGELRQRQTGETPEQQLRYIATMDAYKCKAGCGHWHLGGVRHPTGRQA